MEWISSSSPNAAGMTTYGMNWGLQNKEIILYAGTHGYAHGMERILQAAQVLQERCPQCHFRFLLATAPQASDDSSS